MSLIISVTFSGLFWNRLLIQIDYDFAVEKTVVNWGHKSAYDSCPGADFKADLKVAQHLLPFGKEKDMEGNDSEHHIESELQDLINEIDFDSEASITKDTIQATYNLYNRVVGDYQGSIKGGLGYVGSLDTQWSMIYRFNSVFYTILSVQSMLLLLGIKLIPVRVVTAFCHCFCTGFVHFAMIITTGAFRYNKMGVSCAKSEVATSNYSTFASDAEFIQNIFISQCVLFLTFCCSSCCAGSVDRTQLEQNNS